ncbi:MAG TPA: YCF48-related protein, partial [Candidatus Sulfotelmatobacter sp.]|nr:YCF48-related protein [Candidatus Sulfotelmatobacter sp.]
QAGVVPNASVRWTITAVGRLQRSLDQGTTWQDVDVNAPSATGSAGVALMEAPTKAKEMSSDILAKKDRSSPLTFRAVASNGPDVWAGTSGGLLYHSTDAGSNWSRTVPSASGVSLTGDIVSLEFVDPQHGRVVTSTPEIWTTSDGGQTWQKQ